MSVATVEQFMMTPAMGARGSQIWVPTGATWHADPSRRNFSRRCPTAITNQNLDSR